ncbi:MULTISPECIES: DUF1329 domain-containing protein [Pseudomonas]|jgi:hypothetical protein|uniref:DUF1329 domain-containing protein n=1 Tax=Pseudomonas TaxID=286 RepID=UPI000480B721|nr:MULTISPECIES: DUF1329 domain-containing protein [Pseudomonas]MBF6037314.1 DUF1329 domain-containing protein [Pseudomonas mucoides]
MKNFTKTLPLVMAMMVACTMAQAKQDDPGLIGSKLTPMGSEKAANADGSIPAWTGGIAANAAIVSSNGDYADPFAGEKPLYTVTKDNVSQYKNVLTPGQVAMFGRFPDYRMPVYPTHRTANLPKTDQDEAKANLGKVELADGGYGLKNYSFGVPFAEPTEPLEVLWNHLTRYRGGSFVREIASATVQDQGQSTVVTYNQVAAFRDRIKDLDPQENLLFFYRAQTLTPSRYAGEVTLIHEPMNQVTEARAAWQYLPGQRRVRRAPTVSYDSSARYSFGQITSDGTDGFNGAPDRYDWKLIGKQELLVGYNAYKLNSKTLKYADLLKPGHLNTDPLRYEKHRVWVIEATLKPDARHVYGKRRFYIDEDSWQILASDMYDSRGELWRLFEAHYAMLYDVQVPTTVAETTYDLISGRYGVSQMTNEVNQKVAYGAPMVKADFTPAEIRRLGK